MSFDPFSAVANLINTGLEKWIPDANVREQVAQEQAKAISILAMAQIEINKLEAQSGNIFIAGWRPFIGWVCGAAYAYEYIIQPFLVFSITAFGGTLNTEQLPELNWAEMSVVLVNLLGFGALRTWEKVKNGNGR